MTRTSRSSFAVQFRQRPPGKVLDQMIQAPLPAQRARDNLGGQPAIAVVVKMGPAPGERGGKVFAVCRHRTQRVIRRGAGGRGHVNRPPG
jgi:hypothetical protein